MDTKKILEFAKFLVENGQNIFFICVLILSWIGFFRFIKSYHWRIYKSLRGKVVRFIKTDSKDFDQEKMLLKHADIVKTDEHILDYSGISSADDLNRKIFSIEKNSLVVIEYSEKFKHYESMVEGLRQQNIPLVIYATGNINRENGDEAVFKNSKHVYIEICNTSVRLVQAIINLCLVHGSNK